MEFEYQNSNDHKEDNIKDALINENKEEINININSDIDAENIDNRDENIINELEVFEPNSKNKKQYNNHKYGLANKAYFLEKYQQNPGNIFNKNDFILLDVKSDGNCGYRCISLQLYGEEDKYYIIRENIYNYLTFNKQKFKNIPLELDGKLISSEDYIEKVKQNKFWMGDLEISVLHKIYNSILFLFELNYNNELHLLQINLDNNNSIILTLCFINNNHYNIIYENINSSISPNINLTNKTLNEQLIN